MVSKMYKENLKKAIKHQKERVKTEQAMFALNVINCGGSSMRLREQAEKIVSSFLAQKP